MWQRLAEMVVQACFPRGYCAQQYLIGRVPELLAPPFWEPRIVERVPDEQMRVQQKPRAPPSNGF